MAGHGSRPVLQPQLPSGLATVEPVISVALNLAARDPVMAYYTYLHGAHVGTALLRKSSGTPDYDEIKAAVSQMLRHLEATKAELGAQLPHKDQASSHCQTYALQCLAEADRLAQDAAPTDRLIQAYSRAIALLDSLQVFGPPSLEVGCLSHLPLPPGKSWRVLVGLAWSPHSQPLPLPFTRSFLMLTVVP